MVSTYSHQRRLNAVKALVLLAVIVALILAPRLVRAELVEHVQRFEGDSRVETAVTISRSLINERHSRRHIVLATADDFADAQSATPLAVRADTAILLTPREFLHPMVKTELARALEPGGTVLIAGGEQALTPMVADAITAMGYGVQRVQGATRIETAIALAEHAAEVGGKVPAKVSRIFAVAGDAFGPGLITSSRAARDGGLMVIGDAGIAWAKTAYPSVPVTVVGTDWSKTPGVDKVEIGDVRTLVDRLPGGHSQTLALASVHNFPDALSGGVHAATFKRDLYLIADTPDHSLGHWMREHYTVDSVAVYGGQVALPDEAIRTLME